MHARPTYKPHILSHMHISVNHIALQRSLCESTLSVSYLKHTQQWKQCCWCFGFALFHSMNPRVTFLSWRLLCLRECERSSTGCRTTEHLAPLYMSSSKHFWINIWLLLTLRGPVWPYTPPTVNRDFKLHNSKMSFTTSNATSCQKIRRVQREKTR